MVQSDNPRGLVAGILLTLHVFGIGCVVFKFLGLRRQHHDCFLSVLVRFVTTSRVAARIEMPKPIFLYHLRGEKYLKGWIDAILMWVFQVCSQKYTWPACLRMLLGVG